MLKPLQRQNIRDRLVDHLIDSIVRRELLPGHRIVERTLSKQLGVAQTTLREALLVLEHMGLITKIDNKGSFVANLTVENVEDLYAVRKQLEPFAAGLAYARMKQDDYEELTTILHQMKACTESADYRGLSMADAAFHRAIWRLSGNKVLERTLNSVCAPLFAFVFFDVVTYDPQTALEEHGILLEALKRGGADHVRRTFEDKMEIFRMRDVKNV